MARVTMNCYTVFKKDRNFCCSNKSRGGGVLLAVKPTLFSKQINLRNTPLDCLHLVEVVAVRVTSIVDAVHSSDRLYFSNLLILGNFNLPEC
jgi:hypothetical protein